MNYNDNVLISNYKNRHQKSDDRSEKTIIYRVSEINKLLFSCGLKPFVDLSEKDTEKFIGSEYKYHKNDIRYFLGKKICNFYTVMKSIQSTVVYIKSGATGHTFKGSTKKSGSLKHFAIKVVAFPKNSNYGSIHDVVRPENAELKMLKLLCYFFTNKKTPHIVLPITTFYTDIKIFKNLIEKEIVEEDNEKYNEFVIKCNKGKYYDHVSILISEWADKGDLLDYLRKNNKKLTLLEWKVIFFQILSVLAIIQNKYPEFRHNDLKCNNILLQTCTSKSSKFRYTINKKIYIIPNIGYQIQLWDFDFSCIPGIVDNAKVSSLWARKQLNVSPEGNRYYDIHFFFNTLIRNGFVPDIMNHKLVPYQVSDFIKRIIPDEYRSGKNVTEKGRLLLSIEYLTADEIISQDPFFREFME